MSKAKTKSPSTTTVSKTSNLAEKLKFYRLNEKAKDALRILSEDQLAFIKDKLNQGGAEK